MRLWATTGLFAFFFFQNSCGIKTGYNFDREADFSKYKTYRWVEPDRAEVNEIVANNIRRITDEDLAARGLRVIDDEAADLYVKFCARRSSEQQYTTYYPNAGPPWRYGPGWRRGWGWGWSGPSISTTTSSTVVTRHLVLDMYDSKQRRLIWQGTLAQELDPGRSPEKKYERLKAGIDKMLENYPPKERSES